MQSQLAGAYCTLAEKHLAGAAEVAAVEEAVEDALRRARQADASSPEPLQVESTWAIKTSTHPPNPPPPTHALTHPASILTSCTGTGQPACGARATG